MARRDTKNVDTSSGEITDEFVRPFSDFLREQASGKTHEELGECLHDLISRVQDTGKKGSVTLTVTVAPMKNDLEVLVVSDEIKLRLPEARPQGVRLLPRRARQSLAHRPKTIGLRLAA